MIRRASLQVSGWLPAVVTLSIVLIDSILLYCRILTPSMALLLFLVVELPMGVMSVSLMLLKYRRERRSLSHREALRVVIGDKAASLILFEIDGLISILRLVRRKKLVAPDDIIIPNNGGFVLLLTLLVISGVELVALHFLLPWEWVRITMFVIGCYVLISVIGLIAKKLVYPHVISRDGLTLREGPVAYLETSLDNISKVKKNSDFSNDRIQLSGDHLIVGGSDGTNLEVYFRAEVPVKVPTLLSVGKRGGRIKRVSLFTKDPKSAEKNFGLVVDG